MSTQYLPTVRNTAEQLTNLIFFDWTNILFKLKYFVCSISEEPFSRKYIHSAQYCPRKEKSPNDWV